MAAGAQYYKMASVYEVTGKNNGKRLQSAQGLET
jgi:hypothetical protein